MCTTPTTLLTREVANADNNADNGDTDQACAENYEACADNNDEFEEGDADGSAKCILIKLLFFW